MYDFLPKKSKFKQTLNLKKKTTTWRWEKPQEGGVELCSQKLLSLRSEKLFPESESEIVQSLTWVQSLSAADNN